MKGKIKMKSGGYTIVDLLNRNIDPEAGGHVDGIYELIESKVGANKVTLVSGVNENGHHYEDFYTKFLVIDSIFYGLITVSGGEAIYLKVESDDDVSIVRESTGGGDVSGTVTTLKLDATSTDARDLSGTTQGLVTFTGKEQILATESDYVLVKFYIRDYTNSEQSAHGLYNAEMLVDKTGNFDPDTARCTVFATHSDSGKIRAYTFNFAPLENYCYLARREFL